MEDINYLIELFRLNRKYDVHVQKLLDVIDNKIKAGEYTTELFNTRAKFHRQVIMTADENNDKVIMFVKAIDYADDGTYENFIFYGQTIIFATAECGTILPVVYTDGAMNYACKDIDDIEIIDKEPFLDLLGHINSFANAYK